MAQKAYRVLVGSDDERQLKLVYYQRIKMLDYAKSWWIRVLIFMIENNIPIYLEKQWWIRDFLRKIYRPTQTESYLEATRDATGRPHF